MCWGEGEKWSKFSYFMSAPESQLSLVLRYIKITTQFIDEKFTKLIGQLKQSTS